jgi:NAD(P)-dependent dehydrogenase (short-subunit alcohol dehydrogenase family)
MEHSKLIISNAISVINLAQTASYQLARTNIRVNAVCPVSTQKSFYLGGCISQPLALQGFD